jgi:glycerol-3-phosphate O-acyltransferase
MTSTPPLVGPEYKVPRLVREDIWSSARFRAGLGRLASELGRTEADVTDEARQCLDEMVAGYGRCQIDLARQLGRFLYRQAYEETLDVDRDEAARVVAEARHHTTVVLPTHRSNLDSGVMPSAWHQLGLPPTHTFAGINMAFWPLGPIMRRSGSIFIRRRVRDDPAYRYVLREYLGYLIEKGFHLEWYIEGGRSRTGKLLPPRLGLLSYVIDAYREGRTDDVVLVPASITYDHLREVADFAGEARGEAKQRESIRWLVGLMRGNRGHRYGRIYVRFGEPLSLRNTLGPPTGSAGIARGEKDRSVQEIGFEVSWRINQATPVTATALLTLLLLGAPGRALTYEQVRAAARQHVDDAEQRKLPMTDSAASLRTDRGVGATLDALIDNDVVVCSGDGPDTVYVIGPDQHLAAAFYRNSILHHFLDGSIAELALVSAAEPGVADPVATFWTAAIGLRDLLRFEFLFRGTDEFRAGLAAALVRNDSRWQERVAEGPPGVLGLLRSFRVLTAPLTLRSFLEAYSVVALELARRGSSAVADDESLVAACEGYGRQRLLQKRIQSPESVSRHVFRTGLRLAGNRGLVAAGDDLASRRSCFVTETEQLLRRLDAIEAIACQVAGREHDDGR